MNLLRDVPDDVISLILLKLEASQIQNLRSVNTNFRDIIDGDKLVNKKISEYSEIFDRRNLEKYDNKKQGSIFILKEDSRQLRIEARSIISQGGYLMINKHNEDYEIYEYKNEYQNILFIFISNKLYIIGVLSYYNIIDRIINKVIILSNNINKIFHNNSGSLFIIRNDNYKVDIIDLADKDFEKIDTRPIQTDELDKNKYIYISNKFLIYINNLYFKDLIYFGKKVIVGILYYTRRKWHLEENFKKIFDEKNKNFEQENQTFLGQLNTMTRSNKYDEKILSEYHDFLIKNENNL